MDSSYIDQLPTFDTESKSPKIPKFHYNGWEGVGNQLPTFDAESKSAKVERAIMVVGLVGDGRGLAANFKLLMLIPNLLESQSLITIGLEGLRTNFQLLMLSPILLKS